MSWSDVARYKYVITAVFEISLLAMAVYSLVWGSTYDFINCLFGMVLVALPVTLEAKDVLVLPFELVFIIFVDLFLYNFGIVAKLFDNMAWLWSPMMHFMSTTLIAILGLMMVIVFDYYVDEIYLPRKWLWFFILIFAMSIGVFWEILEFSADTFLGTNMQYSYGGVDPTDTIEDLCYDLLGGTIVAILGPLYLKYRSIEEMVRNFRIEGTMGRILG